MGRAPKHGSIEAQYAESTGMTTFARVIRAIGSRINTRRLGKLGTQANRFGAHRPWFDNKMAFIRPVNTGPDADARSAVLASLALAGLRFVSLRSSGLAHAGACLQTLQRGQFGGFMYKMSGAVQPPTS